jgi:hypothetical protein
MPTEVAQQIEKKTVDYAKKIAKELTDLNSDLGPRYWRMAELISEIKEKSLWQILGHESETEFRDSLYISRSGWYEKWRLFSEWAELALKGEKISRAQLNRMPSQNVKQLMRLDLKRRFAAAWITKALTLKEADLTAQVDHVLLNDEEPEEGTTESRSIFKVECTKSQKQVYELTMKNFARENNIETDDRGKILELIMADVASGLHTEEELKAAASMKGVQIQ